MAGAAWVQRAGSSFVPVAADATCCACRHPDQLPVDHAVSVPIPDVETDDSQVGDGNVADEPEDVSLEGLILEVCERTYTEPAVVGTCFGFQLGLSRQYPLFGDTCDHRGSFRENDSHPIHPG